jgi:hypothetical protein
MKYIFKTQWQWQQQNPFSFKTIWDRQYVRKTQASGAIKHK